MTPEQIDIAITAALENGYRHIDIASYYNNEKDVGNALKKWLDKGGERRDLFIVANVSMTINVIKIIFVSEYFIEFGK